MRWRRFAFWATFGTLVLIVLALSWLWTADLGVFRPQLEQFVSEQTGREFSINGEFHVDLGGSTTVIAEELRFGNPAWAGSEDMVTVGRAEVRFDLWSLIKGPVLIELIDVDDTNVLLLNPGDKAPNWQLPIEVAGGEDDADDEPGPGVLFAEIDIDRLRVHVESVERERPLDLVIDRFDQVHRDDNYLDLEVRGTLGGRKVEIDGAFGPWEALLAGKDFESDFNAELDTFSLSASGRIDDIADLRRPEFEFTASGPDVDDLTRLLGLGEEGEGDINLTGSLRPVTDGPLALKVEGNIGLTKIDAHGEIADLQSYEKLRLRALSSGPDLGRVLRLVGIHQVRESPYMLDIDAEMTGERLDVREATLVFAEARFEGTAQLPRFPSIDDAVIRLEGEGPDIERFRYITGVPGAATGPFSLKGTVDVRDDGVELLDLRLQTGLGVLEVDGTIGDPDNFYGSRIRFKMRTDNLARTADAYGIEGAPTVPLRVNGYAEYGRDGIRTIEPLVAEIVGNSATVEGLVPLTAGAAGADLDVTAEGSDLAALAGLFTEAAGIPALSYSLSGELSIEKQGYRLGDFTGALGNTKLAGDGLLVAADNLAGSRFDVRLQGPALEELVPTLEEFDVKEGPFDLQAAISFTGDRVELRGASLERPNARLDLDVSLGLPLTRRWMNFDVRARGSDVRNLLRHVRNLEAYEQPFSLEAEGQVRGNHWAFDRVVGAVGTANFEIMGDLALDGSKSRTELTLDLAIPNLAEIGTVAGRRFNEQSLSLSARAVGNESRVTVDEMKFRIGNSDVNGSIQWQAGDVPELTVDVDSERLVYLPLLEEIEQKTAAEPEFDDGRLIPDVAVPFAEMKRVNASLVADIKEFQRGKLQLAEMAIEVHLRDGLLELRTLDFRTLKGQLVARGTLSPDGESGTASLEAVARDFAPGLRKANVDLSMTTDLDLDVSSTGADLRTLAGNANGVVYVDIRGGRIAKGNQFIQTLYGDTLEEILNTFNPFRKTDPYTDVECAIVPLTVTDGKVEGAPSMFISTSKIRVVAQGEVNLKNEKIQLSARTTPRRIVSFSAAELVNPYIQVVGTLASPRLAVDESGVLITGGAAVATGGLSLLAQGIWSRLSKSGDACSQVAGEALKELEGRLPDLVIENTSRQE